MKPPLPPKPRPGAARDRIRAYRSTQHAGGGYGFGDPEDITAGEPTQEPADAPQAIGGAVAGEDAEIKTLLASIKRLMREDLKGEQSGEDAATPPPLELVPSNWNTNKRAAAELERAPQLTPERAAAIADREAEIVDVDVEALTDALLAGAQRLGRRYEDDLSAFGADADLEAFEAEQKSEDGWDEFSDLMQKASLLLGDEGLEEEPDIWGDEFDAEAERAPDELGAPRELALPSSLLEDRPPEPPTFEDELDPPFEEGRVEEGPFGEEPKREHDAPPAAEVVGATPPATDMGAMLARMSGQTVVDFSEEPTDAPVRDEGARAPDADDQDQAEQADGPALQADTEQTEDISPSAPVDDGADYAPDEEPSSVEAEALEATSGPGSSQTRPRRQRTIAEEVLTRPATLKEKEALAGIRELIAKRAEHFAERGVEPGKLEKQPIKEIADKVGEYRPAGAPRSTPAEDPAPAEPSVRELAREAMLGDLKDGYTPAPVDQPAPKPIAEVDPVRAAVAKWLETNMDRVIDEAARAQAAQVVAENKAAEAADEDAGTPPGENSSEAPKDE